MKVLLVDDTGYIRVLLKQIVNALGITVVEEADDGVQAVRMYKQTTPDLVIMDLMMPNMNGFEAIKSIIEIDPNAKIIMCSALAQRNLVLDCIAAGAKDFIAKPFDLDRVMKIIMKVLAGPGSRPAADPKREDEEDSDLGIAAN